MDLARLTVTSAILLGWAANGGAGDATDAVDFDRHVRPILSARCLNCHGATGPEAGLDLTDGTKAAATLESGRRAVVPGDATSSELLRRVTAADPAERMPPAGEPLSPDDVDALRRWITDGAAWPPHWAFRPIVRPATPPAASPREATWTRTPLDPFVLAELRRRGLPPSPEADPRTLIRRVTVDLLGLPPTPEQLEAFTADARPDAYERLIDRLLADPRHGERWARHWMDVARFAETHGHDQDRPRPHAWPYRDFLIRAFNEDLPYGRFIERQIAGDALFPDDPWATAATGFLAAGPWDESSLRDIREDSPDREVARYLDRDEIVSSVTAAFTSTTVGCARCHDHKFDPVSQAEYYGLQAVFAATDKANRPFDPDPEVARRRRELLARKASLPSLRAAAAPSLLEPGVQAEVAAWERAAASEASAWGLLDPESSVSASGATLTELPDHSLLSGGTRPETDVVTVTAPVPLPAVTGLRLEVLTDDSLPHRGPGRQDNGNLHLNEVIVTAAAEGSPAEPVPLRNPRADFDQAGWTAAKAVDGNPATAWGIYPDVGKSHQVSFEFAQPLRSEITRLTIRLEQTHGGGHLIGRLRLAATAALPPWPTDAGALPAEIAAILNVPAEDRNDRQRAELAAFHLDREIDRELAALPPQRFVFAGTNRFEPDGSFRPAQQPRTVHVLHRGDVNQAGAVAEPGALSCLPGLDGRFSLADPDDEASRRAAFARWLSDSRNVLTWRSIANRVWLWHVGQGLVDTPDDFGRMGSAPSHPQLLDHLAAESIADGGSLKRLHRLILTSATYRQSSGMSDVGSGVSDMGASSTTSHLPPPTSQDPDNRLLWRMNRGRLDAESIRDALLSVSGELDPAMGGPSVRQFVETPGIHVTPIVDYRGFDPDDPANRRRSVYRFLFRTLPDPFPETFDCPSGSQPTGRRTDSVTALQALAMLHNRFVVRRCEHLAERLERERPDLPGRVRRLFELVLLRDSTPDESEAFTTYAAEHGLANACRMLINGNEFLFVD